MLRHPVLVTIAAVGGSALIRLALDPLLGNDAPMLLFVLGVSVATIIGGISAGMMTTLLSIPVGFYLFVEPRHELLPTRVEDWVRLVVFIFEGIIISAAAGRVVQQKATLEQAVARRTLELRESNEALEGFAERRRIVRVRPVG
jgi:K+-sensing histidine kinase KdpD